METIISVIASPIVEQVIGHLSSLLLKKYQLLQGLEEQVEDISSQLTAIQAVLEDAENKQLDSPPLRDWLQKLKEVLQDVEDTLETFETEASLWEREHKVRTIRLPLSASEISFKSNAAKKIKKHLEKIEKISKERHNFQLNVQIEPGSTFDESRCTNFIVHECDVVGREEDKNKIVDLLLSENSDREGSVSVAPIIGMPGLGKTTLAQLVYNDPRVKGHFEFMMWVCVTDNFKYTKILKDMLEYHTEMTHNFDSLSDLQMESRLIEFLSRKPFLLVLDDVWPETFEWEKLKTLLKNGGKRCRVLVTSRSARFSNVMGTLTPYLLRQLPEDKCWSLFQKTAFDQNYVAGNSRGELEEIGKEIVLKCDGLPLAIKAMGGLLRGNNDAKRWRSILKHKIWDVDGNRDTGKPELLPALKLSYHHLPSHLKRCFAFCCIYPKAFVFRKLELIKVWKAAKLIIPREGDSIDEIGIEYFDRLKSRSFFDEIGRIEYNRLQLGPFFQLLQEDKEETFRMHDLFHDLALSVSSPYFCQVMDNRSYSFSEKVRHVSFLCNNAHEPLLEVTERSKKLRALLSPTGHMKNFGQALEMVFSTLRYIRILDLSSSMMQELQESVGDLKLLRYLDLSRTEIRRLPNSVCNLINLQTLKLLQCLWLFELPRDLGNLTNLQHLELDDMFWHKLHKLPRRMGRITGLQNLHSFHVLNESGYGIDELKDMQHLKGALHIMKLENAVSAGEANLKDKKDLEKVVFEWSKREQDEGVDERILEDLKPHSNLKEVQIIHYLGNRFPSWMREGLTKNLISVSLNHCRKCKLLSLGRLTHLEKLCIRGLLELEEWIDAPYQNLQRLTISNCPELRVLPQCFLNLQVMKIKKCNSLKALPLTPSLEDLTLVDNLLLEDFNEQVLDCFSTNSQGQPIQQERPSFLELSMLKLVNCPMLAKLPEWFAPQKLEVSGCRLLTALLAHPEFFSRRLCNLAIDACDDGKLVTAIPNSNSLFSLVISNISAMSSLPKWPHLPGLKALYISGCKDLVSLSDEVAFEGLDSLELLSIRDCPKLAMLPDDGLPKELKCLIISSCPSLKSLGGNQLLKSLTSLKDLYIENCPELEMLPEDGFSTSLQHLQIGGCPKLAKRCQEGSGLLWPKIMDIPDLEVPSAEGPLHKNTSKAWYGCFIFCKGTGKNVKLSNRN